MNICTLKRAPRTLISISIFQKICCPIKLLKNTVKYIGPGEGLRKNIGEKTNILKILVIRLSSIGDIILTTPVLEALKAKFPDVKLDFLVMDKFKDAISGNKNIDNLIIFKKEKYKGIAGIIRFSKELKAKEYDLIIDLHSKIRSILISKIIGKKVLRYKKDHGGKLY